ncbi:rusa-like resolvase [Gordonia phage Minos]|nr:rusa-like resolvase [Gordonia phage Minos]
MSEPYPNVVAAALPLNPEPWAMGSIYVVTAGRKPFPKVSPNKTLKQYQDALVAELEGRSSILPGPYYSIRYTFSRQLIQYKTRQGKTVTRNWADVTNMQKGTEDALQGVFLPNDRAVIQNLARLIGPQRQSTLPYVVIEIRHSIEGFSPAETAICPADEMFSPEGRKAWETMLNRELGGGNISDNVWTP